MLHICSYSSQQTVIVNTPDDPVCVWFFDGFMNKKRAPKCSENRDDFFMLQLSKVRVSCKIQIQQPVRLLSQILLLEDLRVLSLQFVFLLLVVLQ